MNKIANSGKVCAAVVLTLSLVLAIASPLLPDTDVWIIVIVLLDLPLFAFLIIKGVSYYSRRSSRVFAMVLCGYIAPNALALLALLVLLHFGRADSVLSYIRVWSAISLVAALMIVGAFSLVAICGWLRHWK